MDRDCQYDFSLRMPAMYDIRDRERKAETMVVTLADFLGGMSALRRCSVLDVGASTGIIDNYLSAHFGNVVGVDIDGGAVEHARRSFPKANLEFRECDAMALPFDANCFDVVICSQVYEHVPDAQKLMSEILRVLKPSGVCYFSAGNRLQLMEPHYSLPLLSVIPKPLAHIYVRLARNESHYYEEHLSYWGLRRLTGAFLRHDYTRKMVHDPRRFAVDYMLPPGGMKTRVAKLIADYFYWAFPNYIWLLQKPSPPR